MYAKVFSQILDSSIAENYSTRHVFMDLLVLANKDGIVDMTPYAISRRTNVPLDMIQTAIEKLSSPDADSRSSSEGGRRIVLIDPDRAWGWKIVNYVNYCKLRDENTRQEYMRDYMRRRREKDKTPPQPTETKDLLTPVNTCKPPLAHVPVPVSIKTTTPESAFVLPVWVPAIEWNAWLEVRKKKRASPTDHAMELAVKKLDKLSKQGFTPKEVLEEAILNNWTGIFEPKRNNGGNNGETRQSPAKQRIDGARRVLAKIALDRGLIDFDRHDGGIGAPISGAGPRI